MKHKKPRIKDVFFIQRAAIDILLLNKATAIEICTYLVICRYTDRYGYESIIGYKGIKERLGLGQRKISEAIRRLTSMEFEGQRLLYSKREWLYKQTGNLPHESADFGWIRGWIDSEYHHDVWLHNALVGKDKDKDKPLNYFVKVSGRDNHARLLLLLFKYHNRQYSGVNYKFASIIYEQVKDKQGHPVCCQMNGHDFFKSRFDGYHISQNIMEKLDLTIALSESCNILQDLQDNNFLNISISVLGVHNGPLVPSIYKTKREYQRAATINHVRSKKQMEAWETIKKRKEEVKDLHQSFRLVRIPGKTKNSFAIGLKKIYKNNELAEFKDFSFEKLADLSDGYNEHDYQFYYRLDYKSNKKHDLCKNDCLAGEIDAVVRKSGLVHASRNGKFYDMYWWLNPCFSSARLVAVVVKEVVAFVSTAKPLFSTPGSHDLCCFWNG